MEQVSGGTQGDSGQHRWLPISAIERRILGVLAEKAKTTPDIYPMSLNAICTGSNQKNNRSPLMQLEPSQVEESLDRLREMGAVGLVEGYGRVQKYRHYLYEWLGADKVELAVMAELLLRGDQTVGELRVRASRMEPIADQAALQTVLNSLKTKGLVISLTSEGRGHVVTHALYKPREIEQLRAKYSAGGAGVSGEDETFDSTPATSGSTSAPPMHVRTPVAPAPAASRPEGIDVETIRRELSTLRQQVAQFQEELTEVRNAQSRTADELRSLKDSLGG